MTPKLTSLIKSRVSCRHFTGEALTDQQILNLLEAARWAPSARNDQPWNFIVAPRSNKDEFDKAFSCLVEENQNWADKAGCLMFACAPQKYYQNGSRNRWGWHDTGMAIAHMQIQGVADGIQMRQMGGIDRDRVRELYKVPEDHDVLEGLAIGVMADSDEAKERNANRTRQPLEKMIHRNEWTRT